MIDFHTHILPNVDDGSKSVEETFNLIHEAKNIGFEAIVFTPHYMEEYYETSKEELKTWINAINKVLEEQKIGIEIYLGNEIYISNNIVGLLENGNASTINDSKYVLFELPFNSNVINLNDIIYDMLQHKLVPILAHPERYDFVQQDPNIVGELIKKGVLIQSNYGSFAGRYGEKAKIIAKKLIINNMVHFLGTDVHRENTIYNNVPQVLSELQEMIGSNKLYTITTLNPNLVLSNGKIEAYEPQEIKLSFMDKLKMKNNI